MSMPLDQQIVDAIRQLLEGITVANGFNTDAGAHVLTEEPATALPDGAILLEVRDDEERLTEQKLKRRVGQMPIQVLAQVPFKPEDTPAPRATARLVLADIRKAIASINETRWIRGVTSVQLGNRSIPPREDGSNYQMAAITVLVSFSEQHS